MKIKKVKAGNVKFFGDLPIGAYFHTMYNDLKFEKVGDGKAIFVDTKAEHRFDVGTKVRHIITEKTY